MAQNTSSLSFVSSVATVRPYNHCNACVSDEHSLSLLPRHRFEGLIIRLADFGGHHEGSSSCRQLAAEAQSLIGFAINHWACGHLACSLSNTSDSSLPMSCRRRTFDCHHPYRWSFESATTLACENQSKLMSLDALVANRGNDLSYPNKLNFIEVPPHYPSWTMDRNWPSFAWLWSSSWA